ncbi:hypothetical protein SK128_018082 [Halocaridina rubra]|uniref:Poly [ADP-ribose] polymerase n=1 Tax=Halocaridina rubra TaxID=373956 RepID=A0AAN9AG26_HALRR
MTSFGARNKQCRETAVSKGSKSVKSLGAVDKQCRKTDVSNWNKSVKDLGVGDKQCRKTDVSKGIKKNIERKGNDGNVKIPANESLPDRVHPLFIPNLPHLPCHSPLAQNPNRGVHHQIPGMTYKSKHYENIPPQTDLGNVYSAYDNVGLQNATFTSANYAGILSGHNYSATHQAGYPIPRSGNVLSEPFSMFHNIPPPSYDAAVSYGKPSKQNVLDSRLTADVLVKTLALFNRQFGTAETLSRQVEVNPDIIVNLSKSRKDLFSVMGNGKQAVIELVPKLDLCHLYSTRSGCTEIESCGKLHICKAYATENCMIQSCMYGHRWDTAHNSTILSKLYLDLIDQRVLHQIVRKACRDKSQLRVCIYYNNDRGCRKAEHCNFLHICMNYIVGKGKCSEEKCILNHNLLAPSCIKHFRNLGVPTNEKPNKVLLAHVAIPKAEQPSSSGMNMTSEDEKVITRREQDEKNKRLESSSSECDMSESSAEVTEQAKIIKKKQLDNPRKKKKTVNSTDVLGNVEIPEVCLFSIDDRCKDTKSGCKKLHTKSLFHWQFESKGNWYNFKVFHSKILEKAYRNVNTGEVELPVLDQGKLEFEAKELLIILGASSWKADFKSMTMACNKLHLNIRRLSTQSSVISSSPKATVFEWYFQDKKGTWVVYGQVDSLGNQNMVCNVTSADIEKKYLSDPNSGFDINNAHNRYKLDFINMLQTNISTNTVREIRRRPSRLAYQKKQTPEDDSCTAIPAYWNKMSENQTHLLVALDPNSPEFQEVSGRLRLTLPNANILKIQRLQNPYLWRLFQYKKLLLSQRYDGSQMNVQKLFHGTDPNYIDTVCKENIDWRQGITHEQIYGKGSYFSHSAVIARNYCVPNDYGRFTVFFAIVIIGAIAKGDPALTQPPSNPSVNALYDTTVDNVEAPTVYVKYDKEEYYPEYVIEFF